MELLGIDLCLLVFVFLIFLYEIGRHLSRICFFVFRRILSVMYVVPKVSRD